MRFSNLTLFYLLAGSLILVGCEQEDKGDHKTPQKQSTGKQDTTIQTNTFVADSAQLEADEEEQVSYKSVDHGLQQFYGKIIQSINPGLVYDLKENESLSIPESLIEGLEGGGLYPRALEVHNQGNQQIGLILFQERENFPTTYSFILNTEPGLLVKSYHLVDVNGMPLTEIEHVQPNGENYFAYYDMGNASAGFSPLVVSARPLSQNAAIKRQLTEKIIQKMQITRNTYGGGNCPPKSGGVSERLSLRFNATGIMELTEFTGLTYRYFYLFQDQEQIICIPLDQFMVSPDGEEIQEPLKEKPFALKYRIQSELTGNIPSESIHLKVDGDEIFPGGWYCAP